MSSGWSPGAGVLELPSGRAVRGRALRHGLSEARPPDFGLYLLGHEPEPVPWESTWVEWRDFGLPSDRALCRDAVIDAWNRAGRQLVEVACHGGRGRTGTALALMALLDGVPAPKAVDYVRTHYDRRAVETPWQRRYVLRWEDTAR